ncbi:hypothetical protein LF65_01178 [Clostridium beijerinckii]|uniref:Glycosyltransferase 2-like domain-containing protein n=1 Tax=Clostridium beijerinckii TaxID=1520 RepID=A0A0B5QIM7_CLOBE|nr:glycosyltransferase family 2 protein [Clostridium beijerinckii]AJG97792.1 hypothetical protein LF65_01178 [Clostridium beijerinckii]
MCKISVIIPYYNRESTLKRALDSVLNQTYKDYEIILIDDGSTDKSKFIVKEYIRNNKNVKILSLSQSNSGAAAARNLGVRNASGEYIAFLDSDDSWENDKLQIQLKYMEELDLDLISTNINIRMHNKIVKKYCTAINKEISFKKSLFKHYAYTPSVVMKKSAFLELGMFPESMKLGEDIYLFERCIRKYRCYVISDFLTNVYKPMYGNSGLTADIKAGQKALINNLRLIVKENNLFDQKVNALEYYFAFIFSYIKYFRRIILCKIR